MMLCQRVYIHMERGRATQGRGLSWPHAKHAPHRTRHTQHMQQLPQLRTSGKFTLLRQYGVVCAACLPVCVYVCVCVYVDDFCAQNVFLLYLQYSTPTPPHLAHFLCHLKSHWCAIRAANAVVRRSRCKLLFLVPPLSLYLPHALSLPLDRQKRVSCLYACYVCGMFWELCEASNAP